jgi:hypothetical protein
MPMSPRKDWSGRARPRRPLAVLGSVALGLCILVGSSVVGHAADAGAVERAATNDPGMSIGVDDTVGGQQVSGNHPRFTVSWNKLSHGA